jgi:DNA-binding MarR family transcriptional regulator
VARQDWIEQVVERRSARESEVDVQPYLVTGRISRIATHLARRQEEVFGRHGLSRGEVGVLSALRIAGPPHRLSPTQLFKALMLSSAGMTSRLDRLERRGLVARTSDPADRRAILVDLTPRGLALVDTVVAANTRGEKQLLAGLSPAEASFLAALLQTLLSRLEGQGGGPQPEVSDQRRDQRRGPGGRP